MDRTVHVAVGVVFNHKGEVLIARRDETRHQGGLWEFPGGKVESGETVETALCRELLEEVHITAESCRHLLEVEHDYGDKKVRLDVWCVDSFTGTATGREGQTVRWVDVSKLNESEFPRANSIIIEKLKE